MQSVRESLVNIPNALGNLFSLSADTSLSIATDCPIEYPQITHTEDEDDLGSQAIPSSLIKEEWQLVLDQDASIEQLETAIARCTILINECEQYSEERMWLVRHLVEFRLRLNELKDVSEDTQQIQKKVILGHHFQTRKIHFFPTRRQYCDQCACIIWSWRYASYICSDCSFVVHHKCVKQIKRVCAHVKAMDRGAPELRICPEEGLINQDFKCADCDIPFYLTESSKNVRERLVRADFDWLESRQCDYTGLFYCSLCHWNDLSPIPARIVNNWDFTLYKVSRSSLQEIQLWMNRPVINLEELNPMLFVFVEKLSLIKKLRENVMHMRKYLIECRHAIATKLIESSQLDGKAYLLQSSTMYTLSDIMRLESKQIVNLLNKLHESFELHIRCCEVCGPKGYICEVCSNKEILYPFDDGGIACKECNSIYHRPCWLRKNMKCIKCIRLMERKAKDQELKPNEGNS